MIIPVILTGGVGTRLWPLSRNSYPKQFLPLASQYSLLQETVLRTRLLNDVAAPMIICNQEHRFIVAEQLQSIDVENATFILEPEGKNTAPAATVAALFCKPDDLLLVLPSDHLVQNGDEFARVIAQGAMAAEEKKLVTFGVKPTRIETGYGYLKIKSQNQCWHEVEEFVEKPDLETAKTYYQSEYYFWNSGIFLFKAGQFLSEIKHFSPDIFSLCQQSLEHAVRDLDFIRLNQKIFSRCPSDSIDYAVMEKSKNIALVPMNAGWSDVGSWDALYDSQARDHDGNVLVGDVISEDVSNSYLRSESRVIVAVGVHDQIIVETQDAVLVADKNCCQQVKSIVDVLKKNKRKEAETHHRIYRPWGYYEVLCLDKEFQVKRIKLKVGAGLSLQLHRHRSEHWVIVRGTAEVIRGDQKFILSENESSYIPKNTSHRLINIGRTELEIIEVQLGSYLGEDDIVRLEDNYGRVVDLVSP